MKTLNKVLDVLEIFLNSEKDELRISEVAKLTGLRKSNINRIVNVLVKRGYLGQKEKWGKYYLGVKFLPYNTKIRRRLKITEIALPFLSQLSRSVKETIMLCEWDGKRAFYREIIEAPHELKIIPDQGRTIPLYCTSMGKIILSNMSKQDLKDYFEQEKMEPKTENTVIDKHLLQNQLETIARENIAYDDEECFIGARSIASGIKDANGNIVACVGVFSPVARFSRTRMIEISGEIKRCALNVSEALGNIIDTHNKETTKKIRKAKNSKRRRSLKAT